MIRLLVLILAGALLASAVAGVIGGTTAATGVSVAAAGEFRAGAGIGTVAIANAGGG